MGSTLSFDDLNRYGRIDDDLAVKVKDRTSKTTFVYYIKCNNRSEFLGVRCQKLFTAARVRLSRSLASTQLWEASEGDRLLSKLIHQVALQHVGGLQEHYRHIEVDRTVTTDAVALVWSSETSIPEATR